MMKDKGIAKFDDAWLACVARVSSDLVIGFPSSFDIRALSLIFRLPDEPVDQPLSRAFRAGSRTDGSCYPDAAAKERRLGRGIWRRRDGEHFRRANH